jgi:hypothetical protein
LVWGRGGGDVKEFYNSYIFEPKKSDKNFPFYGATGDRITGGKAAKL